MTDKHRRFLGPVVEMRKLHDSAEQRIVHSAEMLDRKSLASVGDTTGERLTALLTETKAHTPEELAANVARIGELLGRFALYVPARFTDDPAEQAKYWAVRSGGGRQPSRRDHLPERGRCFPHRGPAPRHGRIAGADRPSRLRRLHLRACPRRQLPFHHQPVVFAPGRGGALRGADERRCGTRVGRYDGSLKAEHGTGRNMAPFLRRE